MNEPDFETTLDRFDDLYLLDFDKELINTSQLQEATRKLLTEYTESLLSEKEKRIKELEIQLSNYAYQIDSAKRERDKAESSNERLVNALKEARPYVQVATVFKHVSLLPKIDSLLTELESK
jgi:CRISPR/Cas system CSM-associated protein Csm2 small subunit